MQPDVTTVEKLRPPEAPSSSSRPHHNHHGSSGSSNATMDASTMRAIRRKQWLQNAKLSR